MRVFVEMTACKERCRWWKCFLSSQQVSRLQSMFEEISSFCVPKRVYPTMIPAVFLTEPIKPEVHVPEDADADFVTQWSRCGERSSTLLVTTVLHGELQVVPVRTVQNPVNTFSQVAWLNVNLWAMLFHSRSTCQPFSFAKMSTQTTSPSVCW